MQFPNIQVNIISKVKLVTPATQVAPPIVPTDWLKCMICQESYVVLLALRNVVFVPAILVMLKI